MKKIILMTETGSDLKPELAEKYGFENVLKVTEDIK